MAKQQSISMSRYLSRRKRQKKVTAHYFTPREKILLVVILLIGFFFLIAGLFTSLQSQQDPILTVLIGFGLLFWTAISIFLVDLFFFETY